MRPSLVATVLGAAGVLAAVPACAHSPYWESPGSLVSVSVEVEGRSVPLYPAPDGSGRFYLEAREGERYAVTIGNHTHERLGVVLTVDGLNAISGDRERAPWAGSRPGPRMYILDAWDSASVKGWRTSLDDIRRFTFVDERASYAARSGKANSRMGWIEVAVYRERPRPYVYRPDPVYRTDPYEGRGGAEEAGERSADASEAPAKKDGDTEADRSQKTARGDGRDRPSARNEGPVLKGPPATVPPAGGYPGTGWGARQTDPAMLVDFEPEASPAEKVALRYEYASALRALGILPAPGWARDRLRERESGDAGFAKPPRW
jgi:hypothetical protein